MIEDGEILEDREESYFVSMTDLMIGMVFIFVIILMSFALSLKEAERSNRQTVEQVANVDVARGDMLERLRLYLIERGVAVEVAWEHGVLRLPEEVLFGSGRAELSPEGLSNLAALANGLRAVLPCYAGLAWQPETCGQTYGGRLEAVLIEGHTDSDPVSPAAWFRSNLGLSAFRAINTLDRIITVEPVLAQLANDRGEPIFGVGGYGETRRRVTEERTDADKRANRRIDLRFLMATPRPQELERVERQIAPR
jgi:flagellar motor protein MotB